MSTEDHYHPTDHPDFTRDLSEGAKVVWTADLVNRMANVEHKLRAPMQAIKKGKVAPTYTAEDLWELANELSIPSPLRAGLEPAEGVPQLPEAVAQAEA